MKLLFGFLLVSVASTAALAAPFECKEPYLQNAIDYLERKELTAMNLSIAADESLSDIKRDIRSSNLALVGTGIAATAVMLPVGAVVGAIGTFTGTSSLVFLITGGGWFHALEAGVVAAATAGVSLGSLTGVVGTPVAIGYFTYAPNYSYEGELGEVNQIEPPSLTTKEILPALKTYFKERFTSRRTEIMQKANVSAEDRFYPAQLRVRRSEALALRDLADEEAAFSGSVASTLAGLCREMTRRIP